MDPIVPALVPSPGALLDERGRPDFRDVFGALASSSTAISTAVTRVRLSTLDLRREELSDVRLFRVLVAQMNALSLDAEARALQSQPRRAPNLEFLTGLLESGRLELRSAPLAGWSPDFTVFFEEERPRAVLTGFHWFERPYPHRGPALAGVHLEEGARLAARRHAELWEVAHDIGPAVWDILTRALARRARATG